MLSENSGTYKGSSFSRDVGISSEELLENESESESEVEIGEGELLRERDVEDRWNVLENR